MNGVFIIYLLDNMSFDRKEILEHQNAKDDELFAAFYGYSDISYLVDKICNHMYSLNLGERYDTIVSNIQTKNKRTPKLAIIVFAIWLFPNLKLGENALPRRFEPFQENIKSICMELLEGKSLSLQEFVKDALTDYIVTPKQVY
jgi:hypothetical protein